VRIIRSFAISLVVMSAIVTTPSGSSGRTCQYWGSQPTVGSDVSIEDVSAAGSCAAWAVGSFDDAGTRHTLILRWDGTNWAVQPSPNRGVGANFLRGVTAVSANDAWAVGSYFGSVDYRTLILHWNGTAWKAVKSPNAVPDSFNDLFDVDAVSASNVWAVGERDDNGLGYRALILHWNGTAWKLKKAPDVAGADDELFGVGAASGSAAWAVGCSDSGGLILRWNGTRWRRVSSPNPGTGVCLWGATGLSADRAWAVGQFNGTSGDVPLVLRWNGKAWKRQKTPTPGDGSVLRGVDAAGKRNAWAVGQVSGSFGTSTMVFHWDGSSWKRQPSWNGDQTFPLDNNLSGVAAIPSGGGAWAVGDYDASSRSPSILHCC